MWRIEYTKRFLKELAALPKTVRLWAEVIVFKELNSANPVELGYMEKMTGYSNKYKIRLGDYRIGMTMDKSARTIICRRVAHRSDIYRVCFLEPVSMEKKGFAAPYLLYNNK